MEIYATTPAEAFCMTVLLLQDEGQRVDPRGMPTIELLNLTLHISDPMSIPFDVDGRDLNHEIAVLEILQLLGQTPADSLVRLRNKAVAEFQDWGISYGNYGARLRGQLTELVKELRHDGDSRRAVATIYDGTRDLGRDVRDVPCTIAIQCFIRDGALVSRVSMRSNDAWLGLPYDLHQFCAFHCALAEVLSVAPGEYVHTVGSMHLYEKHWAKASFLGESLSKPQVQLFAIHIIDGALERLEAVTTFCQDVINGTARPTTSFEQWLWAEVHDD